MRDLAAMLIGLYLALAARLAGRSRTWIGASERVRARFRRGSGVRDG